MKFQIENTTLTDALGTISKLSPPVSGHITIEGTKKGILLHSLGDLNKAKVLIPARIEGKLNSFAVDLLALQQAIRARQDLTMSFSKAALSISSGRYKATLSTFDPLQEEDKITSPVKGFKIDTETSAYLRDAAKTVALAPDPLVSSFTPLGIHATKKGTSVVCYDAYHSALSTNKEIKGDFSFVVPSTTILSVLDIFYSSDFTLQVTESSLLVSNVTTVVQIGLPVFEDNLSLSHVLKSLQGLTKAKTKPMVVNKDELQNFLDNSKAIATKERMSLDVKVRKNKMQVKSTNVNGEVTAVLETKAEDCQFSVNLDFVSEAVAKCGTDVPISLVGDSALSIQCPKATFVMATNQEG